MNVLRRFAFVSLVLCGVAVPIVRAGDEVAAAIASLRQRGALVVMDEKNADGNSVVEIQLCKRVFGDADLAALKRFPNLKSLNLQGSTVTDDGVKHLAALPGLHTLDLWNTAVTPAGLEPVAKLKSLHTLRYNTRQMTDEALRQLLRLGLAHKLNLASGERGRPASIDDVRELQLWSVALTDAGLRELSAFKNVTTIDLSGTTTVTLAGLKELKALKSLTLLNVGEPDDTLMRNLREADLLYTLRGAGTNRSNVRPRSAAEVTTFVTYAVEPSSVGVKELTALTNLEVLELPRSHLDDAGMKHVAEFKSLRKLVVNNQISDAGLKELVGMPALQAIAIEPGAPVTDAGLASLAKIKTLESIRVRGTKVTAAGLKHLAGLKLHTLALDDALITDATLRELREMNLLHALSIAIGKGRRPTSLETVTWMRLDKTQVTDAGLQELRGMTSLEGLSRDRSRITEKGVAELRKAIPGLMESD